MVDWVVICNLFPGWSLEEVKGLSQRERKNWLEIATSFNKALVRK